MLFTQMFLPRLYEVVDSFVELEGFPVVELPDRDFIS